MRSHRNRPSTAPIKKLRNNDESQLNSMQQSTSTTKIIKRQVRSSRNNSATNKTKYKSSQNIHQLTKGLLLDILPNKYKPLRKSKSSLMLKIAESPPLIYPLTSRPLSVISKTQEKKRNSKNIMTPYEKYTFMDQIHELFFKLQNKEKEKQRLLKQIAKNEQDIEIEEGLRKGVLNESLRQFPLNQHVVLTRAESIWLMHTKNIKDLYNDAVRDAQLRINNVEEFYTTSRSTKIKESVIRLTKKAAKLRSKLNQHLKHLKFDNHEMYQISQQMTAFEDMMSGILDTQLLTNNSQNKMDIIEKEIKLQTSLNHQYQVTLNGLVNDLQRIYQNDENIDKTQNDQAYNIQLSLNEIQEFCAMSPTSKSSKHDEQLLDL